MLDYGVTKVELGVQHVDDEILTYNRRGCTVADTVEANTLLRDAGHQSRVPHDAQPARVDD